MLETVERETFEGSCLAYFQISLMGSSLLVVLRATLALVITAVQKVHFDGEWVSISSVCGKWSQEGRLTGLLGNYYRLNCLPYTGLR